MRLQRVGSGRKAGKASVGFLSLLRERRIAILFAVIAALVSVFPLPETKTEQRSYSRWMDHRSRG
jgi:hypothetical protein